MAELVLTERLPLAHLTEPRRLGVLGTDAGVILTDERGLQLTLLVARRSKVGEARSAAKAAGFVLPIEPRFTTTVGCTVLWAGPEQWLVVAGSGADAEAGRLVRACADTCMAVDQSDARAVVSVSGPKARAVLAKQLAIDLHPRVFVAGMTALTPIGGIAAQIWQTDDAPRYTIAFPRSYAESVWHGLVDGAAEYGIAVES